jgi:hypothetical protein
VSEIKDKATKQRLQVLPYELIFKEPSSDAIRIGNIQSLLATFYSAGIS